VPERRRILILQSPSHHGAKVPEGPQEPANLQGDCDSIQVDSLARAVDLLRTERFDAVYADTSAPAQTQWAANLLQAERILGALPDGVAGVDADLRILWANAAFENWCGGSCTGRSFYDALDSPEILGPDFNPFHTALAGKSAVTRLHGRGPEGMTSPKHRYLELHVTPIQETNGQIHFATQGPPAQGANVPRAGEARISQLIAMCRDVTAEVNQQQKLDALHRAGREMSALSADQLADMSAPERIELLKLNIRRFTHDLLHYDVVEIRLLDPQTGQLVPLLDEGMSPEASQRILYARPEGNGVTGYVADTARSYLCPDTAADPHFIEGSPGARSSLTVPLISQDRVIGTFNVESPKLNAFGAEDLQFAEIFGQKIAAALHTLDLLSAEKRSTASQSIEAVNREVALPVDEILAAATAVLDRYIGHEPEMADKLRKILNSARAIKMCIQKVGENIVPPAAGAKPGEDLKSRLKGMRVLVADHDDRVRRSAHAILGRFGCVVETAGDAQEALTMARLSTYDAILADIRLPDLGGFETFQRLKQVQPQAKVILMTAFGYDPSHCIVKAHQEGLKSVLYKPFRVDQLLDALEKSDTPSQTESKKAEPVSA
jgi:CheY-like chemotaxis protein/GAF domain-containing protein